MKLESHLKSPPCTSPLKLLSSPKKRQSTSISCQKKLFDSTPLKMFEKNKFILRKNKRNYRKEIELFLKKKRPDLLISLQQGKLLLDRVEDEYLYNL